jgi:hypothetical protein
VAGGGGRGGQRVAGNVNRGNVNRGNVNRGNANRANANRVANANRNVNRNTNRNVNRNVNRGTVGAGWARPGGYWWPRGGAVAAGAALGFVSAATAASWAGPAPAAGMCWYYTDQTQHQGFWDYCQ